MLGAGQKNRRQKYVVLRGTSSRYQKELRSGGQAQFEVSFPSSNSFPPQVLLPHPGFFIQMQMECSMGKGRLSLIKLTEVYWVRGGKQKKPTKIPQKSSISFFVPVLNGKICALFSAIVAKLNHFQPLTLLTGCLHAELLNTARNESPRLA